MTEPAVATDVALRRDEVEELLYTEARLLDERRFADWLELMTDDVEYWIPSWRGDDEPVDDVGNDISLLYYERPTLVDYVARTQSGEAHVMDPAPRTDRFVTNVLIADADAGLVRAKWLLHMYRRGEQEFFGGDVEYRLRRDAGVLRIAKKRLLLSNSGIGCGYLPVV